jgi:cytoskeletal protein CcmA (bactofilin family)
MGRLRGELNGFLDAGSRIDGELHFDDTFRVEGRLSGKVVSKGDLVIGEKAVVDAQIKVARLYVSGELRGRAEADRVELAPGSKVYAEVVTPALIIEEGAFFKGQCSMVGGAPVEPVD